MKVPTHEIDVIVPKFIGMDHYREKGKWKDQGPVLKLVN
jgi:hypothetical protein